MCEQIADAARISIRHRFRHTRHTTENMKITVH